MATTKILIGLLILSVFFQGCVQNFEEETTTVPSVPSIETTMQPGEAAQDGDVICLSYAGSFENGTLFDTNIESEAKNAGIHRVGRAYEPFCFRIGSKMVIDGFDEGVNGMSVGETKTITVPPEKGYPYGDYAGKTLIFKATLLEIKEVTPITITILNDKRCEECDTSGLIRQLETIFPVIVTKDLDYGTEEGKSMYQDLGLKYLPAVLFDESITSEDGYEGLQGYLEKVGSYYSLSIGASFDPAAEICDNGIDDNGNGLVDCDDGSCKKEFACMSKKAKPEVELFVMSHCPYGTQIEKGILPVVELLKDKIDFTVKFCSYAMHDKKELDEQTLQYCIQSDSKDKYLEYLSCFLEDGDTDRCLKEVGIGQKKLNSCIKETDEKFKITENYEDKSTWMGRFPTLDIHKEDNERYSIRGSPAFVVNGVVASTGRDPASLLKTICVGFEDKPEECSEKLSTEAPSPGFGFSGGGGGSSGECS